MAWTAALGAKWVDAAGGVEAPAFLLFAERRMHNVDMEKKRLAFLRGRWGADLAKRWPGPIAGFLLGEMDLETFLSRQRFANPVLEAKRLCKAYFWAGVSALAAGDLREYARCLHASASGPVETAVYFEPEFWLARAEVAMDPGLETL